MQFCILRITYLRVGDLMNMKNNLIIVCLSLLPFLTVQATEVNETSDFTLPKIQVVPIKDTQADRQYELYIKLPEEYAKNKDKTYPVIYFTDAVWHIEILSASTEFLMEDAILVGISWQKDLDDKRAHASRFRDYTVTKSIKYPKRPGGEAAGHLAFIRNDVIQYVEKHYRVVPEERTYFGYSASGLFGAYILMAQPDTFKNYILGSPALEGDIPFLTKLGSNAALNAALKDKGLNANVFISYGTLEKEAGVYIEEFIDLLKNKNDKSLILKHPVIEGSHQTAFPLTGVRSVKWLASLQKEGNK